MRIRVQKPPKPGSFKKLLQFLKKGLLFLRRYGNIIKLILAKIEYGRLAQLVEHLLDVQEVTGSSPVPSTIQFVLEPDSLRERVRVRFLFIENSAEGLLGTVNRNEQRQGIIVVMVSCLLFCGIKVALCELCRPLYGSLGAIAAYVRTQQNRKSYSNLSSSLSITTLVPFATTPIILLANVM